LNRKIEDNLLKKSIIIVWIILLIFSMLGIIVEASSTITIEPAENQYFEFRAAKINNIGEDNKQVIMELWGHNIDFKRV